MAEQVSKALATVTGATTVSTGQSTDVWTWVDLTVLNHLPERLDDTQLATVEHIARLPVDALPPASEDHFLKCMRTMGTMPKRKDDELTGELRLNLYRRHFGSQPAAALSYLVERATLDLKFFPTPQEAKVILDRWSRTDGPHRAVQFAQLRVRQELQARFDDVVAQLKEGKVTQEQVDALPERWKRILATQGFVRDVTYALRPWTVPQQEGENNGGQSPAGDLPGEAGKEGKARGPDEGTGA